MKSSIFLGILFLLAVPMVGLAAQETSDQVNVRLFGLDGAESASFQPFTERYRGAASLVSADIGGDGVEELIIGSGPGLEPYVTIYRQDGSEVGSFLAYDETFDRGVNVAVCDVDGDGEQEIVTAAMYGGGPHIRVFNSWGAVEQQFFAYDESFLGGVSVDCGDVDGDGTDDIVTGPGITGGPHVKVFDASGELRYETFSGSADDNTGISVAVADLNNDGDAEILTARAGYGDPTVITLDLLNDRLTFVLSLSAFENYSNGVNVFAGDIDNDGMDEIGVSTKGNYESRVAFYEMTGAMTYALSTEGNSTEHGVIADVIEGDSPTLATLSTELLTQDEEDQYIIVDISEQTLKAYEHGALVYSSLVSSGTYYYPTPLGRTQVTDKLLWHDYVWSYGEDNPNNYALTDVKYNLRFRQHYYLHNAYWHDNFGNRMSHGCVNIDYDDVEWIYNWADVGATVEIVE